MQRILLILFLLLSGFGLFSQIACPTPANPVSGDTEVPVEALITWNAVEGVQGYIISVGTEPNGTDIANRREIGLATSFRPPVGLPEDREIFVTLSLFFFDRDNVVCSQYSFTTEIITVEPNCTTPRFPINGLTDVSIAGTISWFYTPKATKYRVSLGTAASANDIEDGIIIDGATFYNPIFDLPAGTEIFVEIIPFNDIGDAIGPCSNFSFTTRVAEILPICSALVRPADGSSGVPLNPILEWAAVPNASGYKVSIGSSPTENDVLDNTVFRITSTPVIDFDPNRVFFVKIIPFNSAGEAIGCAQTTFSTIQGCFLMLDNESEVLVSLAPEINLSDTIIPCNNEIPFTLFSKDTADGYRWFKLNSDTSEELISTSADVVLPEPGEYRYEAFNVFDQDGNMVECESTQNFTLLLSDIDSTPELEIAQTNGVLRITVNIDNSENYEFALNSITGPYQDSTVFDNLPLAAHTVFVRDRNGCDVASETFVPNFDVSGFPSFFTPNGDGINDFWQFIVSLRTDLEVQDIYIFDRFGNLIVQVDPFGQGWDGTLNGLDLPESDYWFRANASNGDEVNGHFSLKR